LWTFLLLALASSIFFSFSMLFSSTLQQRDDERLRLGSFGANETVCDVSH
jgi:O-antigen/teichoic acid export membrane protein